MARVSLAKMKFLKMHFLVKLCHPIFRFYIINMIYLIYLSVNIISLKICGYDCVQSSGRQNQIAFGLRITFQPSLEDCNLLNGQE